MNIDQFSTTELQSELARLQAEYGLLRRKNLNLDLTRGKPGTEQLALSSALDGILRGNYLTSNGTDVRNYGGIDGLDEAKVLLGEILGTEPSQTMIGGNSSLTMMYQTILFALSEGIEGPESAWGNNDTVKFLCPSPGYDRHFSICEHLGLEMVVVPMLAGGPDMDVVEQLVAQDTAIKGMWCVPRFSNPTGCVYSDETVKRIAQLGSIASDHFLVMWDNAYAVHAMYEDAEPLASIVSHCSDAGTLGNVFLFGSTSKVTFAGAGVAFMGSSTANISALKAHLAFQTIGPDKINQLRHVLFLENTHTLAKHMEKHAAIIRPRFECVLAALEAELAGTGMGTWTKPRGGYFISFDSLPGLAKEIIALADDIGVKLTPAGATFPYGKDPLDCNIRLAPTFPSLADVQASIEAFVVCVKLASVRQKLG
ncbi:MAG: aminotransferase class I/II-fold pyridoxal phosphate-dependent enzyme [Halieaceae bacterium]|nr:aminotransferase class I/II-fold pyridoxal phosphate-dependent enzyme [Halieaceae bacterium]